MTPKGKMCIIMPTYNESENIVALLKSIFSELKKIKGWKISVLVVDDKSPDGTADKVRMLMKHNKSIYLLNGEKKGLGVAYTRGFRYVFDELKPEVVFQMDADFSHPVSLIPEFLKKIEQGADFVIGSRYITGGATPDWHLSRKAISKGGNMFARKVAGINEVHDCTSGFRAIRVNLLKKIDMNKLGAKGYSFQMNLLYEAKKAGAKFSEIPLVFYDRKHGKSKMRSKDIVEFFINSFYIRLKTWARFVRFIIVGGSGVIVNTGVLFLLTEVFGLHYQISSIFAIQLSIFWNFMFNDKWTFRRSTNKSSVPMKLLKFEGVSIMGALINLGVLILFTEVLGVYYLVSNFIGILVATAWNFFMNNNYTWRDEDG